MLPQTMFPLDNSIQRYDWGSPTAIPELLGIAATGEPAAELWLGSHWRAPSVARLDNGHELRLDALLQLDPALHLGGRIAGAYGGELPFLLKVLAAEQALSLQVHPRPDVAQAGFARENQAGVPKDSAERTFHDTRHKPELVLALTEFTALAGFRTVESALELSGGLGGSLISELVARLRHDTSGGIQSAFELLLSIPRHDDAVDAALGSITERHAKAARIGQAKSPAISGVEQRGAVGHEVDAVMLRLAEQHPGDAAALVPLLMNLVTLAPGEALFLNSGEIHSYIYGLAIEVMTSSDNVIRAGLTHKHIDLPALLEATNFEPGLPIIPQQVWHPAGSEPYLAAQTISDSGSSEPDPHLSTGEKGSSETPGASGVGSLTAGEPMGSPGPSDLGSLTAGKPMESPGSSGMDRVAAGLSPSSSSSPPSSSSETFQMREGGTVTLLPPVPEFALVMIAVYPGQAVDLPGEGPRIVLCLAGELRLVAATGETRRLMRGESLFVSHAAGMLTVSGGGQGVCAYLP